MDQGDMHFQLPTPNLQLPRRTECVELLSPLNRARRRVFLRHIVEHQHPVECFTRRWRYEDMLPRIRKGANLSGVPVARIEPPRLEGRSGDGVDTDTEGPS